MTQPNQYTLRERGIVYGLHRFKDGEFCIVQRHESGDWITLCKPTAAQIARFESAGERTSA